jgi:hypothetical protein
MATKSFGKVAALLIMAVATGSLEAKHHKQEQEIEVVAINTARFDPAQYSGVTLRLITDDKFLNSVGERHNIGKIAERADWWDDELASNLKSALRPGNHGWEGTRPLQLTVGMLEMVTGKFGTIRWEFHLWDGQTQVADFTVKAPNRSGYLTDSTGIRHRKEMLIPIVDAINEFLGGLSQK